MAIITICNHKGGTGKTTTVIHLAAALGLAGKKTLAIDLDPQGFLTRTVGLSEPPEDASSLALFGPGASLDAIIPVERRGFDVIPSSTTLTRHMRALNKPTDVLWLREVLSQKNGYDAILLDTAAAITVYSLNALVAAEHVLIPVTPEYQPVVGAEQTYQTCELVRSKLNPRLKPAKMLLTRVDARKRSHTMYRRYLGKQYSDAVMHTVIRTSTSLSETHGDGSTVFDHDLNSRGAVDYANATDELIAYLSKLKAVETFLPRSQAV